jgi:starch synthase
VKVSVGSAGRFHTFDLARQLDGRGCLRALYTAYPRWKVDGLPPDKVRSFPWVMGPAIVAGRLGLHGLRERWNYWVAESFDRWVASRLEACDLFHCLSSFGIESHRVARERYGALTVCDRGSSHILYQDRIFVPSSFVYRSFVQKGVPEAKLVKIPYGVDLSLFRPVPKEDDVFRVIYVGALSLQKGIPDLLEAVCALRLPRFEVWLIGACLPEVRPFLRKYEGRYRHLGVIPRKELYRYYSQSSVFVIASVEEGLALVQAQAMACGLPVIATKNTGAEDLFTDGVEGFIVPIRAPEAIREKVLYLYGNPEIREEMARAALERVRSPGGWETYASMVVAAYNEALKAREGRLAHPAV